MPNSLSRIRQRAAEHQKYRCYYCCLPVWCNTPDLFILTYGITKAQALQLQCTAEHLVPKNNGGTNSRSNIVAACWYCNHKRHARLQPLNPSAYKHYVQQRISKGRWLSATLPEILSTKS